MVNSKHRPKLSICIATYNRAGFIGATLDSILVQMAPGVELVVVDGASSDETPVVMASYVAKYAAIRYYREKINSGVDQDYDKAIGYAVGEYCWLMPDDDLMLLGALQKALSCLNNVDLVVVNSKVCNADLSQTLLERRLAIAEDKVYESSEMETFFTEVGAQLSFIGCVIIRRDCWMARERRLYYGSLFIHVGVIFQDPPLAKVLVLAEPMISIRYGNAMWTPRAFEIWMFKWPNIIWSFRSFSDQSRKAVYPLLPWRKLKKLGMHRASGSYTESVYRKFFDGRVDITSRLILRSMLLVPPVLANAFASIYCAFHSNSSQLSLLDLLQSRHSTWVTRTVARLTRTR